MFLNPFIEIRTVKSGNINEYFLMDYLNRKKYSIDKNLFLFICQLSEKQEYEILKSNNNEIVSLLIKKKILLTNKDDKLISLMKMKERWSQFNWEESFKYHMSTLDYPFEGNLETASNIMKNYGEIEKDNLRDKKYLDTKYSLMDVKKFEKGKLNYETFQNINVTKEKLLLLLSFAFGFVKSGVPSWSGDRIYHRTTPSGGSRQPTQGYLYVIDIPGIESGWYYINGNTLKLEQLDTEDEFDLNKLVIINSNYKINPKCIIVLTSLFEKNMYRYREPRTFRTVHIDVGHMIGVVESLASKMDIIAVTQYGLEDEYIEKVLDLNFLDEGYQSTIVLGTRNEEGK